MAPKQQNTIQRFATSATALIISRLMMMASAPLFAFGAYVIIGFYNDSKLNDMAQLTAISAVNATMSMIVERLEGNGRTQAAIDAAQDFRMAGISMDIADHESRIRVLEAWRTNVINRSGRSGDPL